MSTSIKATSSLSPGKYSPKYLNFVVLLCRIMFSENGIFFRTVTEKKICIIWYNLEWFFWLSRVKRVTHHDKWTKLAVLAPPSPASKQHLTNNHLSKATQHPPLHPLLLLSIFGKMFYGFLNWISWSNRVGLNNMYVLVCPCILHRG